jgi:hypothetical protein
MPLAIATEPAGTSVRGVLRRGTFRRGCKGPANGLPGEKKNV